MLEKANNIISFKRNIKNKISFYLWHFQAVYDFIIANNKVLSNRIFKYLRYTAQLYKWRED